MAVDLKRPLLSIVLGCLVWSTGTVAQTAAPPLLPQLTSYALFGQVSWMLTVDSRHTPLLAATAGADLLTEQLGRQDAADDAAARGAVRSRLGAIRALYGALDRLTSDQASLSPASSGFLPAIVGQRGTETCVVLSTFMSTKVYNTIQLTARARASTVFHDNAMPILRAMGRADGVEGVTCIGVSISYGSKNFLDRSVMATKGETLVVLAPLAVARQFAGGDLTEDDLLAKADVYLADRDATDLTKVKLALP